MHHVLYPDDVCMPGRSPSRTTGELTETCQDLRAQHMHGQRD
jgi:hypothetical protein